MSLVRSLGDEYASNLYIHAGPILRTFHRGEDPGGAHDAAIGARYDFQFMPCFLAKIEIRTIDKYSSSSAAGASMTHVITRKQCRIHGIVREMRILCLLL